jgi:hypothetical protein
MRQLTISGSLVDHTRSGRASQGSPDSGFAAAVLAPTDRPTPRLARMLALAHFVERLVEQGKLRDLAHAARAIGVSRARMTQIVNLAYLPAREQEAILLGKTAVVTERRMRHRAAAAAQAMFSVSTS